jgi:hypothetical protein
MNSSDRPSLAPDDYEDIDIDDEDNPELTDTDVAKMRPLSEVLPDLYEALIGEDAEAAKRKAS